MRVLIVSQYFWPEEFRINEIAKSLVELRIEVDVLTGKPNYPEGNIFPGYRALGFHKESWNEINIFRLPLFPRGQNSSFRLILNYLSFVFSGIIFGPFFLRKRKYDVVFVYGLSPILLAIPGIFMAWLRGKKLILWVQDLWPESLSATGYINSNLMLRLVEVVVRWIYSCTDLLLVQSRVFEKSVAAMAPGKKIMYYPNSVDSSFSQAPSGGIQHPILGVLEEGFSIVFAGNVGAAQAIDCIVEAATLLKDIPPIRFVIFGSGSRLDWLRGEITRRGLKNVYLAGRFPLDTMPKYLQKAGALIVSLSNKPIFALTVPNKLQAYMASGRPIIASLNGEGARLIDESGAGISVAAEDPIALAEAILLMYQLPEDRRKKMGENGRAYYRNHFDHATLVNQLIHYLELCSVNKKDL